MSDQTLPNMRNILSAARTYKRACRSLRAAQKAFDADSQSKTLFNNASACRVRKNSAADRLLYLVETGERSYRKPK